MEPKRQTHTHFVTTTRGLDRSTPPMRLFEKAKIYGTWNPSEIDFTQDKHDWDGLADDEKDLLLRLTAMFVAGEEAVTLDLLPLILAIASEGRIEEEMYLTTFLWEEAKHTDFFQRLLNDVMGVSAADLSHYHTPSHRHIFYEVLPGTLNRLMTDQSPEAQVLASVTYNMIVEGVLAETGYHAYFTILQQNNLMPGNVEGIQKLKQDESRHIAYGIYLISRLVAENPEMLDVAQAQMNALMMPATGVINEIFAQYDPAMPFDLKLDNFIGYAMMQFQKRMGRVAAAKGATLQDVMQVTQQAIDNDDA